MEDHSRAGNIFVCAGMLASSWDWREDAHNWRQRQMSRRGAEETKLNKFRASKKAGRQMWDARLSCLWRSDDAANSPTPLTRHLSYHGDNLSRRAPQSELIECHSSCVISVLVAGRRLGAHVAGRSALVCFGAAPYRVALSEEDARSAILGVLFVLAPSDDRPRVV